MLRFFWLRNFHHWILLSNTSAPVIRYSLLIFLDTTTDANLVYWYLFIYAVKNAGKSTALLKNQRIPYVVVRSYNYL